MKLFFKQLLGLSFLLTIFLAAYGQDTQIIREAKNIAKGGYSIFDGTMVDMPWTKIEQSIDNGAIVFLPIAVIEEHGPHMNCGPDIYQISLIAKMIKYNLDKKGIETLIALPVYWGIADIGKEFPGNFTVSEHTFRSLLHDIFVSLNSWGVKKVIVFIGHGEPRHSEIINETILKANNEIGINTYFCSDKDRLSAYKDTELEKFIIPVEYNRSHIEIDCRYDNHHAGCYETGIMAGFFPEMVDTLLARELVPTNLRESKKYRSPREATEDWYENAREVTPLGYFGDPASFDADKSVYNVYQDVLCEAEAIELFFSK